MAVFFFMSTALTATPVAPSLSSGLEFGRANWTAADHAAARASCRFVAGGRAYDLRALAGLTVVAELRLGIGPSACAGCGRGTPPPVRPENLRKRVDARCAQDLERKKRVETTRARAS